MAKNGPSLKDYQAYEDLVNFPLLLWQSVCGGVLRQFPNPNAPGHYRVSFSLANEQVEIDTRLIARIYRGWWARVWFPLQTGKTLTAFCNQFFTRKVDWKALKPTFAGFVQLANKKRKTDDDDFDFAK